MAEIKYDPRLLQDHAARLYAAAQRITAVAVVLGVIAGIAFAVVMRPVADLGSLGYGLAALLCAGVGSVLAEPRAFALRLQAQLALCQIEIEANTRRASGGDDEVRARLDALVSGS